MHPLFTLTRCCKYRKSWEKRYFVSIREAALALNAEENRWAKSSEAQGVFQALLSSPLNPVPAIPSSNILKYISSRYNTSSLPYSYQNALKISEAYDLAITSGNAPSLEFSRLHHPFIRNLTDLLSFPLSLGHGINMCGLDNKNNRRIRITILGARSEASLPILWWKECLVVLNSNFINDIAITFIGPDLLKKSQTNLHSNILVSSPSCLTPTSRSIELSMDKSISSELHVLKHCSELISETDIFVLYNPGLGSQAVVNGSTLQSLWEPTMRLVLSSGKPVIFTSSSAGDLERDLSTIKMWINNNTSFSSTVVTSAVINPYRSLKLIYDVNESTDAALLSKNQYIYTAKATTRS